MEIRRYATGLLPEGAGGVERDRAKHAVWRRPTPKARDSVAEFSPETAAPLLGLARRLPTLVEQKENLGCGLVSPKNSKLAPKYEGAFVGQFAEHDIWFVYALELKDQRGRDLAFKIGYANDPEKRRTAYQAAMAEEVSGLTWTVAVSQATASEDEARRVVRNLLAHFGKHWLGEQWRDRQRAVAQMDILSALAVALCKA